VILAGGAFSSGADVILRSVNQGLNWTVVHSPPGSGSGIAAIGGLPDALYAFGGGMPVRSKDRGATWARVPAAYMLPVPFLPNAVVRSVQFYPDGLPIAFDSQGGGSITLGPP
jgi:hypothetical protein